MSVIRSGLYKPDGKQRTATWVTLTAPGADVFGHTHSQRHQAGTARTCRCGVLHADGDALLGTPLTPSTYRYDLAASFNSHASRLAAVTFQKLGRMLGRKLQVIRVVEFQSRGLVHVHALIIGVVTQRTFMTAVCGGINLRTGRRIAPATSGGWRWGPQCKAQVIVPGSATNLGAYMTKVTRYAVKSAGDDVLSSTAHARKMAKAGEQSITCQHPQPDCRSGSPEYAVRRFICPSDAPPEIAFTWHRYQSRPAKITCRRHRAAESGWGFRGHVLAASRSWGLSLAAVRDKRKAHASAPTQPEHIVIEWEVLGRGYGPEGRRLSELEAVP